MPNSDEVMQRARSFWQPLASRLSLDESVYRRLADGYSEPHRDYHAMDHVLEMLDCLEQSGDLVEDRDVMELAVWFHDVVYDSTAPHGGNETASAELLAELCSGPAVSPAYAIIEHSSHHGPSDDPDTRLFCDLDLYRLAGSYETFLQHGEAVRREYAWIDDAAWKAGRTKFMARLQERPSIYQTDYWRDRLESQAQSNIARLLAEAEAGG
jgi:predicted metal-dependent HD superfamily phosphohydrolase